VEQRRLWAAIQGRVREMAALGCSVGASLFAWAGWALKRGLNKSERENYPGNKSVFRHGNASRKCRSGVFLRGKTRLIASRKAVAGEIYRRELGNLGRALAGRKKPSRSIVTAADHELTQRESRSGSRRDRPGKTGPIRVAGCRHDAVSAGVQTG
jgi:hypothetical protein